MQRSSNSIASLAAALAKAQAELVNPEKSLVATLRSDGARGTEQTFRYAPLSSGLDIVRKTLGQHEIATIQTTAIDRTAGTVNLTTMLAHSSGEWIASDWPVCAIRETATPHRMGAALTYARRYALFTLVGIAGEDDRDAPDLTAPTVPDLKPELLQVRRNGKANSFPLKKIVLDPNASAALRDQLLAEVDRLSSGVDATIWAQRIMAEKNSLVATDALRVEAAFAEKMSTLESAHGEPIGATTLPSEPSQPALPGNPRATAPNEVSATTGVDKSVLALPVARRLRDKNHRTFVSKQPCLICGRQPADAHHLRFTQHRALGRKVSDEFTVPLCRGHHREVHRFGDEAAWWSKAGVDPLSAARTLWSETHPIRSIAEAQNAGQSTPSQSATSNSASARRNAHVGCPTTAEIAKTKPIVEAGAQ